MTLNNTQAIVLAMLHDGPKATRWLVESIGAQFGEFFSTARSGVFREMTNMVHAGLVRSRGVDYAITPEGRQQFKKWLTQPSDADLLRSPTLLRLVYAASMEPEQRRALIESARQDYNDRLREARAAKKALATDLYGKAVADFVEDRVRATLKLLDFVQEIEPAEAPR